MMHVLVFLKKHAAGLLAPLLLIVLLKDPQRVSASVSESLTLCSSSVIPALFPYLVISGLMVRSELPARLAVIFAPVMRRLFGVGGAGSTAVITGLIGGYPVGAATAIGLYKEGITEKSETEGLLAFCSNSGPGFIIGFVGAGLLGSVRAGLILYVIHALTAISTGLLLAERRSRVPEAAVSAAAKPITRAFTESVSAAVTAMLSICAYVIILTLVSQLCSQRLSDGLQLVVNGLLEITGGLALASRLIPAQRLLFIAASAMLAWGGVSVHCQTAALASGTGLRLGRYFTGKLLHCLLAAGASAAYVTLAEPECLRAAAAGAVYVTAQHEPILHSLMGASVLWIFLLCLVQHFDRRYKKRL